MLILSCLCTEGPPSPTWKTVAYWRMWVCHSLLCRLIGSITMAAVCMVWPKRTATSLSNCPMMGTPLLGLLKWLVAPKSRRLKWIIHCSVHYWICEFRVFYNLHPGSFSGGGIIVWWWLQRIASFPQVHAAAIIARTIATSSIVTSFDGRLQGSQCVHLEIDELVKFIVILLNNHIDQFRRLFGHK